MDLTSVGQLTGGAVSYSGKLQEGNASEQSLNFALLHGTLDVRIHAATNLPNRDSFSEALRKCMSVCDPCIDVVPILKERTAFRHTRIPSDPYVCVVLLGTTVARTRVIRNQKDPVWNEHFLIPVAHMVAEVKLVVKDNRDLLGAQIIGEVSIPSELLLSDQAEELNYDLLTEDGEPCNPGAQLKFNLKYCAVENNPSYKHGVSTGVPNTYFPLHKGGRLTLYQDAHVPDNFLPEIELDRGMRFEHRKCWEDIWQAILDAQYLIYIAGWAINTNTKLVRRSEAAYKTLGDLLKQKADIETARVFLLVWDDKTSHPVINNEGVMGTHDEETRRFFKHSRVQCLHAPRYGHSKLSWFKKKVVGTLYTHHQKLVIVDAQGPGNNRTLIAFIGGLDLCDGRYDTPQHSLFHNLGTVFKDDYHNPTFPKVESGGPRQPRHDLHCRIEGPAVYDVLRNFEQCWKKALRWRGINLMFKSNFGKYDDFPVNLEHVPWIISPNKDGQENSHLNVIDESDPETWNIQIFRSIDSGSVEGFPQGAIEVQKVNLVSNKNTAVDMSIHTAYIKAIRSAERFIYIENQYFLGSSFAWPTYENAGANNLIPIELALKIVSKIKAKEDFAVYVVIPMWPEGVPDSSPVQKMLFFQAQTMEMMYTLIAEALKEEKLEQIHDPTDFLNFFCLGNRELEGENELAPTDPPDETSSQGQVLKTRRFMIYVHAKGMIVDDEYLILGSANINQRSMDGSRDTEIAMGAYQPHYTWTSKQAPHRGQVHGYRMSLWAEHLQVVDPCFMEPWSLECVKRFKTIAEGYWMQYIAEEVTEMRGHLLPYPVKIERTGKVVSLPDCENFPDVGGKIVGSDTTLPDSLTT